MNLSKERLEEIQRFENKDFSDCPVLSDSQLKNMKPFHLGTSNNITISKDKSSNQPKSSEK